jgi:hypothetical protein
MIRGQGRMMNDLLLLAGILAGWLLLQLVVLPRLGVST